MTRDSNRRLREAVIVEAVRTPIGRYGGALASVRPDDLAALVLRAVVDRAGLDPALVEDVILGCANQAGEDNRDVARMAVLLAGFPVEVGGLTVNRLCGCGLQAINSAAHAIAVGDGDVFIGGGVESMTRAPYVMAKAEARGTAGHGSSRTRRSAGDLSTRSSRRCTTRTRWAKPPRTSRSGGMSIAPAGRVRAREPAASRGRHRRPRLAAGSRGRRRSGGRGGRPTVRDVLRGLAHRIRVILCGELRVDESPAERRLVELPRPRSHAAFGLGHDYGARVIDSTPPPMNTSPSPTAIAWAAELIAWSPDPRIRLTVRPPTSTGKPQATRPSARRPGCPRRPGSRTRG